MKIYVDAAGAAGGDGSEAKPFRAISEAAAIASAGDEVLVAPGIYREAVDPARAGTEDARITYRAREKGTAVITGAEPVKNWQKEEGGIWLARIPNSFFTDRNPYQTLVYGDWFVPFEKVHTGEVFLDGKSLYEVTDLDKVLHPEKSKNSWDPEFSVYLPG